MSEFEIHASSVSVLNDLEEVEPITFRQDRLTIGIVGRPELCNSGISPFRRRSPADASLRISN